MLLASIAAQTIAIPPVELLIYHESVSRDFRCLQMILMDRMEIPDVPLDVYILKFSFSYSFFVLVQSFELVKLLLCT